MALSSYLQPLQTLQHIEQLQPCVNLAIQVFEQDMPDSKLIDKLRGELLRTLSVLLQYKVTNEGVLYTLKHYTWAFFAPTKKSHHLENLFSNEIQSIENKIITALQGLAREYPINDVDLFDLEPIGENENYWLSLKGRKYRLEPLAEWISTRKAFIYPEDNTTMFLQDIDNLTQLCDLHKISLQPKPVYSSILKQAIIDAGFSIEEIRELDVPQLHNHHIKALQMLIAHYHFSKRQAFEELQGLNSEQADALNELYSKGLRGAHLRNLAIDESDYSPHHTVVLQMLVNEWHYDIETAVDAISNCNGDEVQRYYSMSSPLIY
ncbi:hypothetical protein [Legionella jamestowniensis]|uniref:Uncharacterized protein n=1 Tax=Legionella jamestowniensis TaxID=455 RepID=A0A0W0UK87_9GAMM|nr:hypothetical protein [Legionella jamestowniensis]KTD08315.1 hypothetical protein Ljam_2510 [Legionella jamestowniensis]OCH97158.1 hypothetical protein A8135_05900 [Legionella jamestowniensis]SFL49627.1 hypothetical protein SAMN02746073_0447 [Legionella jamestowniensis DSM 19215]